MKIYANTCPIIIELSEKEYAAVKHTLEEVVTALLSDVFPRDIMVDSLKIINELLPKLNNVDDILSE